MKKYIFILFVLGSNLFFGQEKKQRKLQEVKEVAIPDSIFYQKKGIKNKTSKKNNSVSNSQGLKEITDIGNTTNNSILINKGTSTFTGFQSAFFVGQDETITGTTVANYTDNNRLNSNNLDWTFAKSNRSTFSGNTAIGGVVGAYQIANNSGNGDAIAVYANRLKAEHTGTGNTGFLIGSTIKIDARGSGLVDYARSTSSTLSVDSQDIVVNYAQAMHPTLSLQNGSITKGANIMYLDYDVNNLFNLQGDLSYIEAGEDGLTNFSSGGEKRFIYYRGKLKSDFNGIINVQNPLADIENATEKVLVTKEYVKNEFSLDKNKSPWNNTDESPASQLSENINFTKGNVGIGTTDTKGFLLGVKGQIVATEVKIASYDNWADFVFDKNYKLATLKEVEKHIQQKGHLKDIPTAKEVEKNGFYLAEMNAKLLKKVEELTLYLIAQDKRIEILEKKLEKSNEK